MSQTIDEEQEDAVPDTLSDPPPLKVDEAAKRRGLPKLSPRQTIVAAAVAALAALILAVFGLYFFFIRYEPVARRHIPGNAAIAVRVDFAKLILFGPVRDHLWPLVTGGRRSDDGPSRLEAIRDATGIDLRTDGRELVIASADGTTWVAALGGRFPRGRFVKGLAKVAKKEQWSGYRLDGDFLVGPGGVAFGQADDGTIIVGSSTAVATAALPASDEYKRLDLADDAAVTFAVTHDAWGGASSAVGMVLDHTPALGRVERATGKLSLGSARPSCDARRGEARRQQAAAIARLRLGPDDGETRLLDSSRCSLPDVVDEEPLALLNARSGSRLAGDGAAVTVTTPWPYEGLERACARLESTLRALGAGR